MPDNQTFKALWVTEANQTFNSNIIERPISDLPAGEVLIAISASSLNYKDALSISGNKGVTKQYPHTPGIDAVGKVVSDTSGTYSPDTAVLVTGFDLGMNTAGGFGAYIKVPASWVLPLPKNLTPNEAMIYGTAGLTAGLMIDGLIEHNVQPQDGEILVTGASGGVGSIAVAILAKLGYQVVAVSGKSSAVTWLKELGAKDVISRDALGDPSRPMLKERWAGVIDVVGGTTLAAAIKATRYGGTVTCSGLAGSADLPLNVFPFILRGVKLIGIDSVQCPIAKRQNVWKNLATSWKPDKLTTINSATISLDEVSAYAKQMLNSEIQGRIVVQH